jgi:hypothetical protein
MISCNTPRTERRAAQVHRWYVRTAAKYFLHPLGQTLIITSGLGWVQREGGPIEEIRPGDVVWFPPGRTPSTAMSHIAIQESLNGSPVTRMEQVSDEQYRK